MQYCKECLNPWVGKRSICKSCYNTNMRAYLKHKRSKVALPDISKDVLTVETKTHYSFWQDQPLVKKSVKKRTCLSQMSSRCLKTVVGDKEIRRCFECTNMLRLRGVL